MKFMRRLDCADCFARSSLCLKVSALHQFIRGISDLQSLEKVSIFFSAALRRASISVSLFKVDSLDKNITPKAAARVSASSPQGDAAFAC
jgi:hypothetical protein